MRRHAGFTLIELLVTIAVLAIFIVAILGLLDTSQRVAKTESALADTQENVRYAAYHLLRNARMVGGTAMPFARNDGSDVWVAAQLQDNQAGFTDDFGQARTSVAGSDVLTLRGFFETSPYFIRPADINWSSDVITVREEVGTTGAEGNNSMNVIDDEFNGRGVVLMGQGQYAIAVVADTTAPIGTPGTQTFTLTVQDPTGLWLALNPGGAYAEPTYPVYRVAILDSYTYYVDGDHELRRIRATGGLLPVDEPVALNIGSLQAELGVDTVGDGVIDTWYDSPTVAQAVPPPPPPDPPPAFPTPIAIRISLFGRTAEPVLGWREPVETFNTDFPGLAAVVNLSVKWRRIQVTATLRDFVL